MPFRKSWFLFLAVAGLMVASMQAIAQKVNQPLRAEQLAELTRIGIMIGKGKPLLEVHNSWKNFVSSNVKIDVDKAIGKVITESKQESQRNIAVIKEKVQFHSLLRKTISNEISTVRTLLKEINQTKDRYINLQRKAYLLTPDTRGQVIVMQSGTITTKKELSQYIDELDTQLKLIREDTRMTNIDLQNAMQKQQQLLSMLSGVSKQLSDSAMSVIRKMGA